jgi:hypothetical protein
MASLLKCSKDLEDVPLAHEAAKQAVIDCKLAHKGIKQAYFNPMEELWDINDAYRIYTDMDLENATRLRLQCGCI